MHAVDKDESSVDVKCVVNRDLFHFEIGISWMESSIPSMLPVYRVITSFQEPITLKIHCTSVANEREVCEGLQDCAGIT